VKPLEGKVRIPRTEGAAEGCGAILLARLQRAMDHASVFQTLHVWLPSAHGFAVDLLARLQRALVPDVARLATFWTRLRR